MTPHPESARILRAAERIGQLSIPWSGTGYRSASPRYANGDDLMSGGGSMKAGARWNAPSSFPAVYCSLDPHTALDEVLSHYRFFGIPIETAMPRVIVSIRIQLHRILDLTRGKTRSALHVSEERMLGATWRAEQKAGREALTQSLGRILHDLGWEGVLVPSAARKGGVNLVIFRDNQDPTSTLEIIKLDQLPRRA